MVAAEAADMVVGAVVVVAGIQVVVVEVEVAVPLVEEVANPAAEGEALILMVEQLTRCRVAEIPEASVGHHHSVSHIWAA
jgi:coenzyme F420-reducing hydrogenase beta subunit